MMFLLLARVLHVRRLADTSLKWGSPGAEMLFAMRRSVAAKQKRNMDLSRDSRATLFCSFVSFFVHDLTLVKNEMNTAAIQISSMFKIISCQLGK